MANFVYTQAKAELLKGTIDFDAPDDIRALLVMTNTTADTEEDKTSFLGFTTLDEFDGSGYSSPGVALTSEAVSVDTVNNRGEFDADDAAFGALGAGTRDIAAVIVYKFITDLNSSLPIAYIDTVSGGTTFPFTANGSTVTIQWNAEGIIQAT
jgi:hypothetical protein